jgi:hypothetical protein
LAPLELDSAGLKALAVPHPDVYSTYGRPPESDIEKFMILLLQSKGEDREKANAVLPTRRSRDQAGELFSTPATGKLRRRAAEKTLRRTKQVKT